MSIEAMRAVWAHSKSRGNTRMVLTLIANAANPQGWDSFQFQKTLAAAANLEVGTVQKCVAKAVALKELEVDRPDRSEQNRYSILLPGLPIHDDPEERARRDAFYETLSMGRATKTKENRTNKRSEDPHEHAGPRPDVEVEDPHVDAGGTQTPVGVPPAQASGWDPHEHAGLKGETPRNPNETPLKVSDGKPPEEQDGLPKQLCEEFGDLLRSDGVKIHNPASAEWIAAARLMLERDGRHPDEIRSVMRWSRGDEFWRANVLSMPKLRKQFDQLRLKAAADPNFKADATLVQLREAAADITLRAPDRDLGKAIREAIGDDPVDMYIAECWHGMRGETYVLGGIERIVSWVALRYGAILSRIAQDSGYAGLELITSSPPANTQSEEAAA